MELPDLATAPAAAASYAVEFTVQPRVLSDAIREATSGIRQSDDQLVFIAIASETLHAAQGIAPDIGTGRLVIGAKGEGLTHVFVDVPAVSVVSEGIFIVPSAKRLRAYAEATRDPIHMHHFFVADEPLLQLQREGASTNVLNIPLQLIYNTNPDEIEEFIAETYFAALNHRFTNPTRPFSNPEISKLLRRAFKMPASTTKDAESRHGDLLWTPDMVEFVTKFRADDYTIGSRQRVDTPILDEAGNPIAPEAPAFIWGIPTEQIRSLQTVSALPNGATMDFAEIVPGTWVCRTAYEQPMPGYATMYVQRQFAIDDRPDFLKDWIGDYDDSVIFSQDNCKLFAVVTTTEFVEAVRRLQVSDPSAIIRLERVIHEENDTQYELLQLATGGSTASIDSVPAASGPSELSHLLLHNMVVDAIAQLVDTDPLFQILSFPITDATLEATIGPEHPRGFFVVPVPPGENPYAKIENPSRYILTTWK